MIEYNGYCAKVDFDDKDNIFVGTVLGLSDILAFHGKTVEELSVSFQNCIKDYIDICKVIGKQPDK